jgi:hypothetical protein
VLDVALDQSALADAIKAAMDAANKEAWKPEQFADALAEAIHTYTSAAEVVGVRLAVEGFEVDQTGTGALQ